MLESSNEAESFPSDNAINWIWIVAGILQLMLVLHFPDEDTPRMDALLGLGGVGSVGAGWYGLSR